MNFDKFLMNEEVEISDDLEGRKYVFRLDRDRDVVYYNVDCLSTEHTKSSIEILIKVLTKLAGMMQP